MLRCAAVFALLLVFALGRNVSADDSVRRNIAHSTYAWDYLDEGTRLIYTQLYTGIAGHEQTFRISATDSDRIFPALEAVMADCPEFFWIDGSAEISGNKLLGIWSITLGFNVSPEEIESAQSVIDAGTEDYLSSLPEDAGDYDKVLAAYRYVIDRADYVNGSAQSQNIQSVFLYGSSVCAGYARAFKYLLDHAGVECAYIEGTIGGDENQSHAWNLVRIGDVFTQVDPSWGDPNYGADNTDAKRLDIIYDYLCFTTEEMQRSRHVPAHPERIPDCSDRSFDYYVLNGCFYEEYDSERISRALWHAVDEAESVVYLKFAGDEDYRSALYALFPEDEDAESLIRAPLRQRMEWDEVSTIQYYYSHSDEMRIIKIYW